MENKRINISQPIINEKIIKEVNKILSSRHWVQGKTVAALEKSIAHYSHAKYAIAVSSGTAALHTLLSSFQFKKDDEIITTPFTFIGTVNAIILAGAKPVFADISLEDFNLDPLQVERKITKKTKAILAVDLYGQPANYQKLSQIAKKNNLLLLGDSAQSIGSLHSGKQLLKFADAVIYSLYATKNISGGEGGIIVTDNKKIDRFARAFRHQGQDPYSTKPYSYIMPGLNYRMTEMQAAIVLGQMTYITNIIKKRQQLAERYIQKLKGVKGLILPTISNNNFHVFHQFTVRITKDAKVNRDMLKQILAEYHITTGVYYPQPLHLIKHLEYLGYKKGDFKIAEEVSTEVLSLPIHYYLSGKDQDYLIKIIKSILD